MILLSKLHMTYCDDDSCTIIQLCVQQENVMEENVDETSFQQL